MYRYAFIIDHWNALDIARMLSTELSPDDVLDLLILILLLDAV